ncbi:MAG TPA: VWA domain-containing protein, partial [Propionicimonas sp.]
MIPYRPLFCLALGLALLGGCTDAQLESVPIPPKPPLDDKLRVEGSFCTEDPTAVEFPVKILFVVDVSDSMSVTDPPNPLDNNFTGRTRAVIDVINQLSGTKGVAIGMITFHSSINDLTHGFVPDYTPQDVITLTTAAQSLQSNAAQTNYEGALDAAFQVLVNDMRNADEKSRSRSKYVVIFLSDGMPNPVTEDPPTNTDDRIFTRVRDIYKLEREQQLRELKVHTVYLAGQTPPQYQQVPVALLKNMADEGHGTFRNIANGERINFITVDFTSFRRAFILKSFYVGNRNARPGIDQAVDSDGDGLSDEYERLIGTDPTLADTDGDGFSDLLEDRLRNAGFDPLNPGDADCAITPTDDYNRRDDDGDGLRNCEERFLGTSPRVFDTDADGVPDGLEVLFGMNPVAADDLLDLDHDGAPNGVE